MIEDLFQKAKDNLNPIDFYIRNSSSRLADDYDAKYSEGILEAQHKRILKRLENLDITENKDDSEKTIKVFRVVFEFGLRIVDPAISQLRDQQSDEAQKYVKTEILAEFVAEYEVKHNGLKKEALAQFAEKNVTYHLWPYWREHVMSICQRCRLPNIIMPTIQI